MPQKISKILKSYLKTKASQNLEHKTTCILGFKNLIIRRKKRFESPPPSRKNSNSIEYPK